MTQATYRNLPMLKNLKAADEATYRFLGADEELPAMEVAFSMSGSITRPGRSRCNALGLRQGDCQQLRFPGSNYCYYHSKIEGGLLEPTADVYPVWPLPTGRWELVKEEILAA